MQIVYNIGNAGIRSAKDVNRKVKKMNTEQQTLIESAINPSVTKERLRAAIAVLEGDQTTETVPAGFISVTQARTFLGGISRTNLWKCGKTGLKSYGLGRRRLYLIADLNDFVKKNVREKND